VGKGTDKKGGKDLNNKEGGVGKRVRTESDHAKAPSLVEGKAINSGKESTPKAACGEGSTKK